MINDKGVRTVSFDAFVALVLPKTEPSTHGTLLCQDSECCHPEGVRLIPSTATLVFSSVPDDADL